MSVYFRLTGHRKPCKFVPLLPICCVTVMSSMEELKEANVVSNVKGVHLQEFDAQHTVWLDKGLGDLEVLEAEDGCGLLRWVSTESQEPFFIQDSINEDTQFMLDKAVVLVLIRDQAMSDVAFTFPSPVLLSVVWNELTRFQNKAQGEADPLRVLPATVTPSNLPNTMHLVCNASNRVGPWITAWLLTQGALQQMFDLFEQSARLGDHESARLIELIVHSAVLLCDRQLLDSLTVDETFWTGLLQITDYRALFPNQELNPDDFGNAMVQDEHETSQQSQSFNASKDLGPWDPKSGPHVTAMGRASFVQVGEFKDASLQLYIHQNHKLSYWMDHIIIADCVAASPVVSVVAAGSGDWESVVAVLKEMIAQNNVLIVASLCEDDGFWQTFFGKMNSGDSSGETLAIRFLAEFVQMSVHAYQATLRLDIFQTLTPFGLFDSLAACVIRVTETQKVDEAGRISIKILEKSLGGESTASTEGLAVRQFLVCGAQQLQGYPLFRSFMLGAVHHPSVAWRSHCFDVIRKLVCKSSNFDEPTDETLVFQDPHNPPSIFQTAALCPTERSIYRVFYTTILPIWEEYIKGTVAGLQTQGGRAVVSGDIGIPIPRHNADRLCGGGDIQEVNYHVCQILSLCLEGELYRNLKLSENAGCQLEFLDETSEPDSQQLRSTSLHEESIADIRANASAIQQGNDSSQFGARRSTKVPKMSSYLVQSGMLTVLASFLLMNLQTAFVAAGVIRLFTCMLLLLEHNKEVDIGLGLVQDHVLHCIMKAFTESQAWRRNTLLASTLLAFFDTVAKTNCKPLINRLFEEHSAVLSACSPVPHVINQLQALYAQDQNLRAAGGAQEVHGNPSGRIPPSPSHDLTDTSSAVLEGMLSPVLDPQHLSVSPEPRRRISDPNIELPRGLGCRSPSLSPPHSPSHPVSPTRTSPLPFRKPSSPVSQQHRQKPDGAGADGGVSGLREAGARHCDVSGASAAPEGHDWAEPTAGCQAQPTAETLVSSAIDPSRSQEFGSDLAVFANADPLEATDGAKSQLGRVLDDLNTEDLDPRTKLDAPSGLKARQDMPPPCGTDGAGPRRLSKDSLGRPLAGAGHAPDAPEDRRDSISSVMTPTRTAAQPEESVAHFQASLADSMTAGTVSTASRLSRTPSPPPRLDRDGRASVASILSDVSDQVLLDEQALAQHKQLTSPKSTLSAGNIRYKRIVCENKPPPAGAPHAPSAPRERRLRSTEHWDRAVSEGADPLSVMQLVADPLPLPAGPGLPLTRRWTNPELDPGPDHHLEDLEALQLHLAHLQDRVERPRAKGRSKSKGPGKGAGTLSKGPIANPVPPLPLDVALGGQGLSGFGAHSARPVRSRTATHSAPPVASGPGRARSQHVHGVKDSRASAVFPGTAPPCKVPAPPKIESIYGSKLLVTTGFGRKDRPPSSGRLPPSKGGTDKVKKKDMLDKPAGLAGPTSGVGGASPRPVAVSSTPNPLPESGAPSWLEANAYMWPTGMSVGTTARQYTSVEKVAPAPVGLPMRGLPSGFLPMPPQHKGGRPSKKRPPGADVADRFPPKVLVHEL